MFVSFIYKLLQQKNNIANEGELLATIAKNTAQTIVITNQQQSPYTEPICNISTKLMYKLCYRCMFMHGVDVFLCGLLTKTHIMSTNRTHRTNLQQLTSTVDCYAQEIANNDKINVQSGFTFGGV